MDGYFFMILTSAYSVIQLFSYHPDNNPLPHQKQFIHLLKTFGVVGF